MRITWFYEKLKKKQIVYILLNKIVICDMFSTHLIEVFVLVEKYYLFKNMFFLFISEASDNIPAYVAMLNQCASLIAKSISLLHLMFV